MKPRFSSISMRWESTCRRTNEMFEGTGIAADTGGAAHVSSGSGTLDVEVDVATLTIALPDEHLSRLKERADLLGTTPDQLVRVGVEALLARPEVSPNHTEHAARRGVHSNDDSPRSILELDGLGMEIWGGVDAREYIDRERASWTG
jgi:hypothetical protein